MAVTRRPHVVATCVTAFVVLAGLRAHALAPRTPGRLVRVRPPRATPGSTAAAGSRTAEDEAAWQQALRDWGLERLDLGAVPGSTVMLRRPPMVVLPNFLSGAECDRVIALAREQRCAGNEATNYLNFRVNEEVKVNGVSEEAASLIEDECDTEGALAATDTGGFRVRLRTSDVEALLFERLTALMGLSGRKMRFDDRLFVKPDPRTLMVRDQTVVHYLPGDGVPPHVDGNDATLLVYLSDAPAGGGGRTVFPEDDVAVVPKKGLALLYWSDKELLHFSERVGDGPGSEKYIMQLLLDFNYLNADGERNGQGTFVDWESGTTFTWP